MERSTTLNSQSEVTFKITLSYNVKNPSAEAELTVISFQQKSSLSISDDNGNTFSATLHGVKINKRIYQPNEIEAEIDFMKTSGSSEKSIPDFEEVSKLLKERAAKVMIMTDNKVWQEVAKNYYVHEIHPQIQRGADGNGRMYVKLIICSMDKLMTLKKYSQVYTARKLGSGILREEAMNFGTLNDSNKTPIIQTDYKNLRWLRYNEEVKVENNNTKLFSEFIHPYLVQYNESFYDFLSRCASRFGEFLYFEDGKLTLGLPATETPLEISDYSSVTLQDATGLDELNIDYYTRDSMKVSEVEGGEASRKDSLNQDPIEKGADGFPKDAFPEKVSYNSEVANDEYFFPLFKDKFSSVWRETNYNLNGSDIAKARFFPLLRELLSPTTTSGAANMAIALAKYVIVDEAISMGVAKMTIGGYNDTWNKRHINPWSKGANNDQYDDSSSKVVQFGTADKAGWATVNYLKQVYSHEKELRHQIICINMGTNFIPVKLGQQIKISGTNKLYTVIQINQTSDGAWHNNYYEYDKNTDDRTTGKRSQMIYAIPGIAPETGTDVAFYPPLQNNPVIRKADAQTAFVVMNDDPKYQGRVRIVYPWQTTADITMTRKELEKAHLKTVNEHKKYETLLQELKEIEDELARIDSLEELLESFLKLSDSDRKAKLDVLRTEKATLEKEIEEAERDAGSSRTYQQNDIDQKKARLKEIDEEIGYLEEAEKDLKDASGNPKADYNAKNNPVFNKLKERKDALLINKYDKKAELETTGKYVEASETDEENKKERVKKKIESIASPWIRVASPMATSGGGTYFSPQIGDEVLVDYDNGNVERPYVTGSLFSKNVLDPRERIQRRFSPVSLRGNLSMTMVSPNGHHIAFSDPPGGGSFITNLISPGLGFYGSVLPIPGLGTTPNDMGKDFRDLSGGIHIGDRWGIYEIEMLSHKRSIRINSPLGTVDINAFNGITINAPNGDITINGKNITLNAGNKITMNSGTNIDLPDCGETPKGGNKAADITKAIIDGVGKALVDEFAASVFDLSYIRHVIEVFVRPVDGTMLIKSRKYLKLEAGLGQAVVKRDRYKQATKESKDTSELFYLAVVKGVNQINRQVDTFFTNYDASLRSTQGAWNDYLAGTIFVLESFDNPDIGSYAYNKREEQWSDNIIGDELKNLYENNAYDEHMPDPPYKENDGSQRIEIDYDAVYNSFKPDAVNVVTKTWNLYHMMKTDIFKGLISDDFNLADDQEGFNWLKDALESSAEKLANGTYPQYKPFQKWDNLYKNSTGIFGKGDVKTDEDPFKKEGGIRTYFKRALILLFLYEVSNHNSNKENGKPGKYIFIGYKPEQILDKKKVPLDVDYWWKRQIKVIDRTIQNSWGRAFLDATWGELKAKALEQLNGFKALKDKEVWDATQDGQILMSDQEDATMRIDRNGQIVKEEEANQGNLNHLKWMMRDIK